MPERISPTTDVGRLRLKNRGTERIISAAIEVFGHHGFPKTTVEDVITLAGVSRPLFYRRFKSKEHLFEVVVDRLIMGWNATLVEEVERKGGGTAASLRVLHEVSLEYGRARPLFHRVLTRDTQLLLGNESGVLERGNRALRSLFSQIRARGRELGDVREDLEVSHMADFLTEVHIAYTDRIVITGAPLEDSLSETVLGCMLGAVLRND